MADATSTFLADDDDYYKIFVVYLLFIYVLGNIIEPRLLGGRASTQARVDAP